MSGLALSITPAESNRIHPHPGIRFQEPADEGFLAASDISSGLKSRGPPLRRGDEIPLHLSYRSQSKAIRDLKLRKRISLTGLYGIFERIKK